MKFIRIIPKLILLCVFLIPHQALAAILVTNATTTTNKGSSYTLALGTTVHPTGNNYAIKLGSADNGDSVTINGTVTGSNLDSTIFFDSAENTTFINNGHINQNDSGGLNAVNLFESTGTSFTNNGTISSASSTDAAVAGDTAVVTTLSNTATIEDTSNGGALSIHDLTTGTNSGTLSSVGGFGVRFAFGGTTSSFTNTNTGLITTSSSTGGVAAVEVGGDSTSGTVDSFINNGSISAANASGVIVSDSSSLGLTNSLGSTISAGLYGVQVQSGSQLTSFTNSGTITSTTSSGVGLYIQQNQTAAITTGTGTIENTGSGAALKFDTQAQTSNDFTNNGTLSSSSGTAVIADVAVTGSSLGFINSGTITGGAATPVAIDAENSFTLDNQSTGIINGSIVHNTAGVLSVTNAGTINAGSSTNDAVTSTVAGADSFIQTGGSVTGNIDLNTASAKTFTIQGGTITGNVLLGNSAGHTVTLTGGTIDGTFNMGNTLGGTATANPGADATMTLSNPGATVFTGNGSTLLMNGAGTLELSGNMVDSGDNNGITLSVSSGLVQWTGNSTIQGGVALNGGAIDLNGYDVTVGSLNGVTGTTINYTGAGGTLTTGASNDLTDTYAGVITGTLDLTKDGTGTQILTGANTYSGTTTISGGTLQIGNAGTVGSLGTGSVVDNANLAFDRTDSLTVSNTISGSGILTQSGTGTLTVSGNNDYTGGTTINAGTVVVSNSNALGGVSAGALANNATLTINAVNLLLGSTYTQSSGSVLNLVANSASSYGKITATGAGSLVSGSMVNVTVENNNYIPNNAVLSIINAGSSSSYSLASEDITSSDPRVAFSSSTSGNDLLLIANRSADGFSFAGNDPNAQSAGRALDNISNPSSAMTTILNYLESLSNAQLSVTLDTIYPIIDAGIRDTSNAALNNFTGATIDRIQSVLNLASARNSDATGVSAGDEPRLDGIWAKEYGSYLNQGVDQGIQGYIAWNTGTAVGLDHLFGDSLTLGVSGGYSYGSVTSSSGYGTSNINSDQCTVYAGYQDQAHPYFVDATASSAWNWYSAQRYINVGALNYTAASNYRGQQYGTYLDGGYNFDLSNKFQLTPLLSLQWDHLGLGHYDETGADALDLNVNRQSYDSLESGLGLRVSTPQAAYNWGLLSPEFHVKWLHDYISDGMAVTSAYAGGGGSFAVHGIKPPMNGADLGGKLSFDLKNDFSIVVGSDIELNGRFYAVSGTAELRYKF